MVLIFFKCYERKNFSRVALECNYTPSMVSKTIRQMEQMLGYELFTRAYHEIQPTTAAHILAREWKNVDTTVIQGLLRANAARNTMACSVRMSILTGSTFLAEYILSKLEENGDKELIHRIDWERRDMQELPEMLEDGRTDIIFTQSRYASRIDSKKNHIETIFSAPDAVFIPRDFPIFYKKDLRYEDLADYPFVMLNPVLYPDIYHLMMTLGQKYGFIPKVSITCENTESGKDNVRLGRGFIWATACCAAILKARM